jgi:hypothetical protein
MHADVIPIPLTGDYLEVEGLIAMKPGTLHTVEDAIAWIYGHEGKIDAYWKAQHDHNETSTTATHACQAFMHGELKEIRRDIQGMTKTIYTAMGGASVLGAVAGIIAAAALNAFVGHA